MTDGDHAQRDDDDARDAAATDGPGTGGPVDDAHVPLPWESDEDADSVDHPETSPAPSMDGTPSDAPEAPAEAAPHVEDPEADLPLVELTLDRTAEAPDTAAAVAAIEPERVAAEDVPIAEATAGPLDDLAAEVFIAGDVTSATLDEPAAAEWAPHADADADDTAYSPLDDTLTRHVVQQHLSSDMAVAPVAHDLSDATSVDAAAAFLGPDPVEASASDRTGEAVIDVAELSVDGLIFQPPAAVALAIPALTPPQVEAVPAGASIEAASDAPEQAETVSAAAVVSDVAPAAIIEEPPSAVAETRDELGTPAEPAVAVAEASYFDINVDAVHDDVPPAEPISVDAEIDADADADDDEPVLVAASAPIMTYADASTPAEEELVDTEADDIDPEPEAVDAAPVSGGMWTIPMLCLGVAVIACCVLIPQADYNRRLVYEHEKLRRDAEAITEQVKVNDEFLRKVADDASLAERLAQRQMKIIRQGTRVLDLKSAGRDETEMSPYHLVTVPAPDPLPPFRPKGGALTRACLNAHTRLYLLGDALVLMAAGLVLGYAPKRE